MAKAAKALFVTMLFLLPIAAFGQQGSSGYNLATPNQHQEMSWACRQFGSVVINPDGYGDFACGSNTLEAFFEEAVSHCYPFYLSSCVCRQLRLAAACMMDQYECGPGDYSFDMMITIILDLCY